MNDLIHVGHLGIVKFSSSAAYRIGNRLIRTTSSIYSYGTAHRSYRLARNR